MPTPKAGTVTVTTAGTRVAFPSARKRCLSIEVRAAEGNTGIVYFGDVDVSATVGMPLHPGTDGVHADIKVDFSAGVSLNSLYLDAATNNDKAHFVAVME